MELDSDKAKENTQDNQAMLFQLEHFLSHIYSISETGLIFCVHFQSCQNPIPSNARVVFINEGEAGDDALEGQWKILLRRTSFQ